MNSEYLNPFSKYTECEQAKCNHFSFSQCYCKCHENKLKQKHVYSVVTLNLFHFRNFDSLRASINSLKTIKKTSLTIKPTLKRLELLVTYVHKAVQYRECP